MNLPSTAPLMPPPDFSRSEAFAEDLAEFCGRETEQRPPARWTGLVQLLPLLVALVGVAFAVLPPA